MMDEKKTAEATPLRQAMQNADRDYVKPAPPLNYGTRSPATLTRVSEALERAERFAEALERATADLERQLASVKGRL